MASKELELDEMKSKKGGLQVNYFKQPKKKMILIKHKEVVPLEKMTSSLSLNDEQVDEDEDNCFFNEEDEENWYECMRVKRTMNIKFELSLLDGAIAPDNFYQHKQQQQQQQQQENYPVLKRFITKEGYIDHSHVAACAVHELSTLALDNNGFLWTEHDILDIQHYQQTFPRPKPPSKRKRTPDASSSSSSSWTHASRASVVVNMEHTKLLQKFTTLDKWQKLFPSIVAQAMAIRFLLQGSSLNNLDGSVQLMYTELQATTPLLPQRNFAFLRTFKQIDQSTWVIADVSVDRSRNVGFPQGCLIKGIGGGLSEVIFVEHLEFEQDYINQKAYTDLTSRGFGFGAQRWAACLERSCQRKYYSNVTDILVPRLVGQEDPCMYEKKYLMKLSQRMLSSFCLNLGFRSHKRKLLSCFPDPQSVKLYTLLRQSPYHDDDPNKQIVVTAITFSLPHSPEFVFEALGNEETRYQWDVSGKISQLTKPTCYATGSDLRNKISVYQTPGFFGNEVVLQEASVNRSGSLFVWSFLKPEKFDLVRVGNGIWSLPLVGLSGLAISSNSHQNTSNTGGTSFVTMSIQEEVSDNKGLDRKTIELAPKKYIMQAVRRVKVFLKSREILLLEESTVSPFQPFQPRARRVTA